MPIEQGIQHFLQQSFDE